MNHLERVLFYIKRERFVRIHFEDIFFLQPRKRMVNDGAGDGRGGGGKR